MRRTAAVSDASGTMIHRRTRNAATAVTASAISTVTKNICAVRTRPSSTDVRIWSSRFEIARIELVEAVPHDVEPRLRDPRGDERLGEWLVALAYGFDLLGRLDPPVIGGLLDSTDRQVARVLRRHGVQRRGERRRVCNPEVVRIEEVLLRGDDVAALTGLLVDVRRAQSCSLL